MRHWRGFFCLVGVLALSGCGGQAGSEPARPPVAAAVPTGPPSVSTPTLIVPTAAPTATLRPPPTPTEVTPPQVVWVTNTDGQGGYLRNTPTAQSRSRAYPDGTQLVVVGPDVDGDGRTWRHVRATDGLEGYVPVTYTANTRPTAAPTVSRPAATSTPVAPTPTTSLVARPTLTPANPAPTCGAPPNPWGYNFCSGGKVIASAPPDFCSYFSCIASFWRSTNGNVEQCQDGQFSHSGGVKGSCSSHGGNSRPLFSAR